MKLSDAINNPTLNAKELFGKVKGLKNVINKSSSMLKENISKNFHEKTEETSELFNSVKAKGLKTKNLEALLNLDKSDLLSSDKKTSFYKPSADRIVIFEKDFFGEYTNITVKEGSDVTVYLVKYMDETPYLYPVYDEDRIPGQIIYMDNSEIWYRNENKTLYVGHIVKGVTEFMEISLSSLKGLNEDNFIAYIKKYLIIHHSSKMTKLINEKNIDINNIVHVTDNYVITKNLNYGYTIYVYSINKEMFEDLFIGRLPEIELSSFDIILSMDILKFIKDNNYPIEKFEQSSGYIEYWTEVGMNSVCLMRLEIK